MSNEKEEKKLERHSGSVVAQDEELTLWLNKLWARNEPPERIEVYQIHKRNFRGEMIFHEDFKPGTKLDIEQANKLANEILAAAENDCNAVRKESSYQIAVIDNNRKINPLVRRIGPLQPNTFRALSKIGEDDEGDDDTDATALNLRAIKEGLEQVRWDKQRNDKILGELLYLLDSTCRNQQNVIDKLFAQQTADRESVQTALDRGADRETMREREKFRIGMWKDGLRTARNLLPGLFDKESAALAPVSPQNVVAGQPPQPRISKAIPPERTLVDNFLTDCEEAKIDIALFGDFDERDGKLVQIKPGIFTFDQFYILAGVRNSQLPVEALDQLIPQCGHANAITEEQINKASEAGVTEGMAVALLELIGLRKRAQQPPPVVAPSISNQVQP
jgi:hypothetical protein